MKEELNSVFTGNVEMESVPKWENKLGEKEGDKGFDVEFWWGWEAGVVGIDVEGMEQNTRR